VKISTRGNQQGIGLVEVMVAAVLLGLGIMLISPMLGLGFRSTYRNKEKTAAVQAGQRIVEEIRNKGFSGASAFVSPSSTTAILADDVNGNKLYIKGDGQVSTQPATGAKLLQVQRIYTFDDQLTRNLVDDRIQVTVKITWPGGGSQHVTMGVTLVRDNLQ
jgi:type II secretory pathway pseudopilin PulG